MRQCFRQLICASSFVILLVGPAIAEFQCAPTNANPVLPEGDRFFGPEVAAWAKAIGTRYTEGEGECPDVSMAGYEGFPAKRCSYATADAGEGSFPPLKAEVIILNPSSRQLAAWSINACRANGAKDAEMPKCLRGLRDSVLNSNGAQFPIVGSVVESYCNSSGKYGNCAALKKVDKANQWLRPRNTWFRDGVSVDYTDAQGVKWDDREYPQSSFDALFDVSKSDANLKTTYAKARIAAATREQWIAWRQNAGKPIMPDGTAGNVAGPGWRIVAAAVHKAACRGASNELFDAVVFANQDWVRP